MTTTAKMASSLPAIRACLFDMDGLLIDSEDLYTLCTNETLRKYGKPDLPWSIKAQLQGRPGPEVGEQPTPVIRRRADDNAGWPHIPRVGTTTHLSRRLSPTDCTIAAEVFPFDTAITWCTRSPA